MCNYVQVCHYVQVYVSICRYLYCTDPPIQTHTYNTYTYLQYLHTYTYIQYLHIPTIPTHSDIPAHTCNTCTYMQYLRIVTYLLIPAIPTYTVLYIHIHVNTYWNLWILANTGQYIQIPAHTYVGHFFLQHSSFSATSQTKNCNVAHTGSYLLIPCDTCI